MDQLNKIEWCPVCGKSRGLKLTELPYADGGKPEAQLRCEYCNIMVAWTWNHRKQLERLYL